ncbi:hypothetical protein THASP1DRAFT_28354 [Thamnocephalis sphaerospora]|uniref:Uncharacterized protein n=1 Tax=Thamnocephalis sphaerospora TaxID=78915 RepID=A0A4P9XUG7_9FUNG|nr:hypothetical protein THASP1DRAFT_28354 [Thamnocephalis sphaerospora]|eukprot:RKP09868.1 hypothetical protein THASP1DRAFT_28354 [Thamnocephalis sphaerospora]
MHFATREEITLRLGSDWVQNAVHFGSIPLHPLGEQSFYQFVMGAKNPTETRERMAVIFQHFSIDVLAASLFAWNLMISARLVRRRPRTIATQCCLIQSVVGLVCAIAGMSGSLPVGPSCRALTWVTTASVRIGDLCVGAVLLQKAYIVTNRNRRLFFFIPVIAAAAPALLYASWSSPAIITAGSGCIFIYPEYFPWLRFGLHAPMNIVLTGIFLNVVYRQWRQFGTRAWEQLAKEGILVGLLMLLSNLLCTFIIAFEVFGLYSIMILLADW